MEQSFWSRISLAKESYNVPFKNCAGLFAGAGRQSWRKSNKGLSSVVKNRQMIIAGSPRDLIGAAALPVSLALPGEIEGRLAFGAEDFAWGRFPYWRACFGEK